jgi:predicted dehydrogenase
MKNLRIGVIGFGARKSIVEYAHQPDASTLVVACADPQQEARDQFRQMYGDDVFLTDDYQILLQQDDLDAVFIL